MLSHHVFREAARSLPVSVREALTPMGLNPEFPFDWDPLDPVRTFNGRWDGREGTEPSQAKQALYVAIDRIMGVAPPPGRFRQAHLPTFTDIPTRTTYEMVTGWMPPWLSERLGAAPTLNNATVEALILNGLAMPREIGELNLAMERLQSLPPQAARVLQSALLSAASERDLGTLATTAKEALAATLSGTAAVGAGLACVMGVAKSVTLVTLTPVGPVGGGVTGMIGNTVCVFLALDAYAGSFHALDALLIEEKTRRMEIQLLADARVAMARKRLGRAPLDPYEAWLRRDFIQEEARAAMREVCTHLFKVEDGGPQQYDTTMLTTSSIMAANPNLLSLCQEVMELGAQETVGGGQDVARLSWGQAMSRVVWGGGGVEDVLPTRIARLFSFCTGDDALWISEDIINDAYVTSHNTWWGEFMRFNRGLPKGLPIVTNMYRMGAWVAKIPWIIGKFWTSKHDTPTAWLITMKELTEHCTGELITPLLQWIGGLLMAYMYGNQILCKIWTKSTEAHARRRLRLLEGDSQADRDSQMRRREKLKQTTFREQYNEYLQQLDDAKDAEASELSKLQLVFENKDISEVAYGQQINKLADVKARRIAIADSAWTAVERIEVAKGQATVRAGQLIDAMHGHMEMELDYESLRVVALVRGMDALRAEDQARFKELGRLLGKPEGLGPTADEIEENLRNPDVQGGMADFMAAAMQGVVTRTKHRILHEQRLEVLKLVGAVSIQALTAEEQKEQDSIRLDNATMAAALARVLEPALVERVRRADIRTPASTMRDPHTISLLQRYDASRQKADLALLRLADGNEEEEEEEEKVETLLVPSRQVSVTSESAIRALAGERTRFYDETMADVPLVKGWMELLDHIYPSLLDAGDGEEEEEEEDEEDDAAAVDDGGDANAGCGAAVALVTLAMSAA